MAKENSSTCQAHCTVIEQGGLSGEADLTSSVKILLCLTDAVAYLSCMLLEIPLLLRCGQILLSTYSLDSAVSV